MPIMHASFTSFNCLVDKYQDAHARNSKLSSPKKKQNFLLLVGSEDQIKFYIHKESKETLLLIFFGLLKQWFLYL